MGQDGMAASGTGRAGAAGVAPAALGNRPAPVPESVGGGRVVRLGGEAARRADPGPGSSERVGRIRRRVAAPGGVAIRHGRKSRAPCSGPGPATATLGDSATFGSGQCRNGPGPTPDFG